MDSPVVVARRTAPSIVFLRSEIPAQHPSAIVLGEERMGTGVAVGPHHVLTAHYLVLGASKLEVAGPEGRGRTVRATALDHESGLALLALDGAPLPPAEIAPQPVAPGLPVFLLTCTSERERKGASGHV
ncbi:MAG TPA: serine protease, partial [Vicinamibacteria bacterium]